MNAEIMLYVFEQALFKNNYSLSTKKTYFQTLSLFFRHYEGKNPSEITTEEIKSFIYLQENANTQYAYYMPLKYFYGKVLKQPEKFDTIQLMRRVKSAPKTIDKHFLLQKISLIGNLKHEAILTLAYSTGMRVGELLSIRLADIDSINMTLAVRDSKELFQRKITLSPRVIALLTRYIRVYTPTKYLFNGQNAPQYAVKSCQCVVQKYIGKGYTMEMIRNSTVSYLLENGTTLKIIKQHLGHADIKTTKRHLASTKHMQAKIKLPM